jgi:enoyl-CoA hydratase/carnithine racemase
MMHEELKTVVVEFESETGVGYLKLNRPGSLNALNDQLQEDIITGLRLLEGENEETEAIDLRVVVIEGAEGNFCAGADINEFSDESSGETSERSHYQFIRDFPVPVIAKIRGYCLGGGLETAMSCDFRIAHEDARLGLPEVDLGIIAGAGGVQMVSRLANPSAAMELAMTGNHINAVRAHDLGIVNQVHSDNLDNVVDGFAETIASKPPLSVQAIKRSGRKATQTDLEEGIAYDKRQFKPLLSTEDHKKGARAFSEEEYNPEFKGQ